MALKGRSTPAFLFTAFLVLEFSLFFQFQQIQPSSTGLARGKQTSRLRAPILIDQQPPVIVEHVIVDGVLDLDVVQQPPKETNFVSPEGHVLTQFSTVSLYGNIGLLAHNYLAGEDFSKLEMGQHVQLIDDNGETAHYVITEILRYQALKPNSPYSSFQNMEDADEVLSVGEMFARVYEGGHHVTFQTCITRDGKSSWGRLFVIAEPVAQFAGLEVLSPQADLNTAYP